MYSHERCRGAWKSLCRSRSRPKKATIFFSFSWLRWLYGAHSLAVAGKKKKKKKKVNTSHAFVYSCLTLCAQHLVFALIPPAGEYPKNSRLSRPPAVLALGFHPSGPRLPGRPQRRKMTLQSGRGRRSRCPSHTPSWTDH